MRIQKIALALTIVMFQSSCSVGEYAGIDLQRRHFTATDIETQDIARRASSGDKNAQLVLARRYRDGVRLPVSKERVCELYKSASRAQNRTQTVYTCDGACQAQTVSIGGYSKGISEAVKEAEALECGLESYTTEEAEQRVTTATKLAAEECMRIPIKTASRDYRIGQPKCYPMVEGRLKTLVAYHVGLANCRSFGQMRSGETPVDFRKRVRECLFDRPEIALDASEVQVVTSFGEALDRLVKCRPQQGSNASRCWANAQANDKPIKVYRSEFHWSLLRQISEKFVRRASDARFSIPPFNEFSGALNALCPPNFAEFPDSEFEPGEREICVLHREA